MNQGQVFVEGDRRQQQTEAVAFEERIGTLNGDNHARALRQFHTLAVFALRDEVQRQALVIRRAVADQMQVRHAVEDDAAGDGIAALQSRDHNILHGIAQFPLKRVELDEAIPLGQLNAPRVFGPHLQGGVTQDVVEHNVGVAVAAADRTGGLRDADLTRHIEFGVVEHVALTANRRGWSIGQEGGPGGIDQSAQQGAVRPGGAVTRIANHADGTAFHAQNSFRPVTTAHRGTVGVEVVGGIARFVVPEAASAVDAVDDRRERAVGQ